MCDNCGWSAVLDEIDEILDRENLPDSGRDFLESVRSWIEENEHVTDAQADGVSRWNR